ASRQLCIALVAASALSAITGPLLVMVLPAAVNSIQVSLDAENAAAAPLMWWIALAAGLSLIVTSTEEVRKYLRRRLEDEIQLRVDSRLLSHVAGLDVATLED